MAEKVLPLPLSGEEVRKAILDRVDQSLAKDCYLSPNLSYDFFDCTVKIECHLHDVGRTDEVNQTVAVSAGEEPEGGSAEVASEFIIESAPPNEVRVATGQPVPVLSKDTDGRPEIKRIKYARKHAGKAKK